MKKGILVLIVLGIVVWYFLSMGGKAPVEATVSTVNEAIKSGTTYLKSKIADGQYHLGCKASGDGECPINNEGMVASSFFIVDAIGDALTQEEKTKMGARIWSDELLGRWGYAAEVFVDVDDTAFAMRALRGLGDITPFTENLMEFYDEHNAGFTTFLVEDLPSVGLVFEPSMDNNMGIHPEVAPNVYMTLLGTSLEKYINYDIIRKSQAAGGYWYSYFYPSKYYSTYTNLRFLCTTGELGDNRDRGISFILNSQNGDGSWGEPGNAYETALALNALAACGNINQQYTEGVKYLLNTQDEDGSWTNSNPSWKLTYGAFVWSGYDNNGVMTTSLAVKALRSAVGSSAATE